MPEQGVKFGDEPPIIKQASEGALDRVLIVATNPGAKGVTRVTGVVSEDNFFAQNPEIGTLDLAGVKEQLKEFGELLDSIHALDGTALRTAGSDAFAVASAEFLKTPESLTDNSIVLQQLRAVLGAIENILDFARNTDLPADQRKAVAQRARSFAALLREEALKETRQRILDQEAKAKSNQESARDYFAGLTSNTQDSYSDEDHAKLFRGV